MTQPPRHGAPGCSCEVCLTARIRLTAAMTADGRDMSGLRARLGGRRANVTSPATLLWNAS